MFLTTMNAPGIHIERVLDALDRFMAGGQSSGARNPVSPFSSPRSGKGRFHSRAGLSWTNLKSTGAGLSHSKYPIG
jgi:hypothetical protein